MIDDSILADLVLEDVSLRLVEPHLYTVYPEASATQTYDKMAVFYDLVMGNRFYNRIMWGYRTADYGPFCEKALKSSSDGWVLDAGCGSLVFTAGTYANYSERPVVLLDRSIEMLRAAKSRLVRLTGGVPSNMVFLHGDALDLPFRPGTFRTVLCMNLIHVLEDANSAALGLKRVTADEGTLSITTLVANNRFGDGYLNMLSQRGLIVPRTADQVSEIFDALNMPATYHVNGNMMYLEAALDTA
jgi:ubiquinone/menaquinone biosynthesis C-methylase UbiE